MRYWIPFFSIPWLWKLADRIPAENWLSRAGEFSFFVYCFHSFVLRMLCHTDCLGTFPRGVVAIVASLGVGWIMRMATPKIYRILSGGR